MQFQIEITKIYLYMQKITGGVEKLQKYEMFAYVLDQNWMCLCWELINWDLTCNLMSIALVCEWWVLVLYLTT